MMIDETRTEVIDPSCLDSGLEPAFLRRLSEEQKIRLTDLLDRYLRGLEQGERIASEKIVEENPDIAEAFALYLSKLDAIYGVAAGFEDGSGDGVSPAVASGSLTLGDFTVLRQIGRGGMGVVYEAHQKSLNRRVAIKLLSMSAVLDTRQIARFRNEAHAAGLLQHPNIVPVHSVGSERGIHYYAMQLIDGVSMDGWVRQQRESIEKSSDQAECGETWRTVVDWGIRIADALQGAHESGVIHRDVKPSNLMLDKNGKIWITDFGLARCQSDVSLTQSGDLLGTMRYMSPEQARGDSALVDGRTDIHSLAATLYEMLVLQPAHDGEDAHTILKTLEEQRVVPLRQFRDDLPVDLETVIAKAMSKHRDGRYETAEEFASDLQRVLAGQPTIARPPTMADRFAHWASQRKRGVFVAVLIGAMGLVGFATSTAMIAAEKRLSDTHAIRAERFEKLHRGAVDRLGSQMAEMLSDIPAAEPVRRRLLAETLAYYQEFAATANNDPELCEDLAVTYGKIGSLQRELGSGKEAIASLRHSEKLYAELVNSDDSDESARLVWSISQNNLAQALSADGQLEEAASYFAKAIGTQERLLHVHATNDVKLKLAATLNNLGLLLAASDAPAEAEDACMRAIALLQPADDFDDPNERSHELASIQTNLSGLLTNQAPQRASQLARDALASQTEALDADRGNAKLATRVIVSLCALGSAQVQDNQTESAADTFRRSIDIGEQLISRWPDQPIYRRDMVISLNHLGLSLSKLGRLREARDAFETALVHQRPLAERFKHDAEVQSMLGGVLNNLGFLHQQLGDNDAAIAAYIEAVEFQSAAVDLASEVKRYSEHLRKHRRNLAELGEAS